MITPAYEIFIDGKPRRVEVSKIGEGVFSVKVDDRTRSLEFDGDKPDESRDFVLKIDGRDFRMSVPRIEMDKPLQLRMEEATFRAEVKALRRNQAAAVSELVGPLSSPQRSPVRQDSVEGAVTSPMTGKVVSVRVKKGDQVEANQVLCVIEAMKMENEITAPKAGVLQEAKASEGSPVSEGEVLFVIS